MHNRFKEIVLFSAFFLVIISPAIGYDGWDYHGSGRDHPYSAYIDRANYVGPADYLTIPPDYIDGPLVLSNMASPALTPPTAVYIVPAEFTVNIPNARGGFNAVVIKKAGEGFIGPKGEYYPEFPKVFQLQMKYGD